MKIEATSGKPLLTTALCFADARLVLGTWRHGIVASAPARLGIVLVRRRRTECCGLPVRGGGGLKAMLARQAAVIGALMVTIGTAHADPIEGNWRTEAGSTAEIGACGSGYCITLKTGTFAGRQIGTFKADGGSRYSGRITDPGNDKTYAGKARLAGNSLKMQGCVLGGLICRSQNWSRM
jgi:uncharacterized protein (DUF2147 family)